MPRWALAPLLMLAGAALSGCPQLLADQFGTRAEVSAGDAGGGRCGARECGVGIGDPSPDASAESGPERLEPVTPERVDPVRPELVDPGVPEAGDVGPGTSETDASTAPSCWVVQLNDTTQSTSDNCLGIHGWNNVVVDEATSTSLDLSYQNGQVCLEGTIAASGWGAVFNFTFADSESWNAAALGVTGFELRMVGPLPPFEIEFIYTDENGDFCRRIAPAAKTLVPFDSVRPDCETSPEQEALDATALTFIRLHLPAASSARDVDFCLQLRATP